MPGAEASVALVHVSAAVAALGAAYAGLDRSGAGRISESVYQEAKKLAKELMQSLGLTNHRTQDVLKSKKWGRLGVLCPISVICVVADDPLHVDRLHRAVHWAYRQWHIPLYRYFQRRTDRMVAGILALIAFCCFFLAAASLLWTIPVLNNLNVVRGAYFAMLAIAAFLIAQAIISSRVSEQRTIKRCEFLFDLIKRRLVDVLTSAEATVQAFETDNLSKPR